MISIFDCEQIKQRERSDVPCELREHCLGYLQIKRYQHPDINYLWRIFNHQVVTKIPVSVKYLRCPRPFIHEDYNLHYLEYHNG